MFPGHRIQSYDRRAMYLMHLYLYLVWCGQNQPHIKPDVVDIINIFCLLFKRTNEFWVRLWSQLDLRACVQRSEYLFIVCSLRNAWATFDTPSNRFSRQSTYLFIRIFLRFFNCINAMPEFLNWRCVDGFDASCDIHMLRFKRNANK